MESVYDQKKYRLLYTKPVDFKAFFDIYTQDIAPFFRTRRKGQCLRRLLEIENDRDYFKLKNNMDPNKAKNMVVKKSFVPKRRFLGTWGHYEFPAQTSLITLNNLKKETKEERYQRIKNIRYNGKIVLDVEKCTEDGKRTRNLYPLFDYMLCVRVESMLELPSQKFSPSQEFWVPANISLEKIKDRIICLEDFQLADPAAETPHQHNKKRKMDVNKHGMFYIGKNFYYDKRYGSKDSNSDYSVEPRKFLKSKNMDPGEVFTMEQSYLKDFPFRLGYPYLYMHQGRCEHRIIFTDARLVKFMDLLFVEDYPLLKSFSSTKGVLCVLCLCRVAKVCVVGCELIPYDNGFLCNTCALSYLYDREGKKKTDFKLYKYIDRSGIM